MIITTKATGNFLKINSAVTITTMAKAITFLLYLTWGVIGLMFLYQAFSLRVHYLEHHKTYNERKDFLDVIPLRVRSYPFISHIIHESEKIVDQGLLTPTMIHWVESLSVYKFVTMDSWYTKLSVLLVICYLAYLVFQYFINVRYVEVMADKALDRTEFSRRRRNQKAKVETISEVINQEQMKEKIVEQIQSKSEAKKKEIQLQNLLSTSAPQSDPRIFAEAVLAPDVEETY